MRILAKFSFRVHGTHCGAGSGLLRGLHLADRLTWAPHAVLEAQAHALHATSASVSGRWPVNMLLDSTLNLQV